MFRIVICIMLALSMGAGKDFSIAQAWEYVLNNNDGIKAEELGTQRAQKMTLASKLSFLPNIDFTMAYMHLGDTIALDTTPTKDKILGNSGNNPVVGGILAQIPNKIDLIKQDIIMGSLNIIYPLYTGGKRYYATKIAALQEKDAHEMLRLKKLATFEELVKIYYGVWLQQEILGTLEEMQKGAQSHLHNAQKLQKAGQIARLEVLAAQVAFDKSKNKTKEATNTLEISRLALDTALGTQESNPTSAPIVPTSALQENQEFFVQRTLDSYPALRSLEEKILITKEVRKIEIAKFLPEVAVMGSYFINNNFSPNTTTPSWYGGVMARMPLLGAGGRIPQIQATKIAQMQLDSTKSQATKDMELLVKRTYKEVLFAKEEYESLDSSIALARENLKLQEQAFAQGLATSLQVSDARNMLSSALIEQKGMAYKYVVLLSKLMALSDNIAMFYEIQK